ncbi:MAG: hypothetical protein NTY35_12235 [Planctomycetota bacterium]|nr:hypothetical protein [Planctomycetota bacterium]
MKWNTILLLSGLLGLGVVGATQGLRSPGPAERTTYWANGKLQSRSETRDGVPSGHSERWYPDGTKQAEGVVRDGRMEGAWEFWLPNGTPDVARTGTYRAGVRSVESETMGDGQP